MERSGLPPSLRSIAVGREHPGVGTSTERRPIPRVGLYRPQMLLLLASSIAADQSSKNLQRRNIYPRHGPTRSGIAGSDPQRSGPRRHRLSEPVLHLGGSCGGWQVGGRVRYALGKAEDRPSLFREGLNKSLRLWSKV